MPKIIMDEMKVKMNKTIESFNHDLSTVRTGRANSAILDNVEIDYYGSLTPVSQVATISVPEARQLLIKPYDKSDLKAIEKAIYDANLNLTPLNDGQVIRINIPALTEDRRKFLAKEVSTYAENAKVAIRNLRRDANNLLKKKEKEIPEDMFKRHEEDVQKATDDFIKKIDDLAKVKEKDLMTI